ncbi:methylenetetrahydrofolate reductase [Platysternon megacephalum]|uniref:Methylenetetrahydrofolate reductase n=1 Tax=Platysternon megacephalum TaxID=55544 RepID=A0A4D9ETX6_9SAUR|nr:methylenetetrahydrofolate reductase [Platysternon megacephalum]
MFFSSQWHMPCKTLLAQWLELAYFSPPSEEDTKDDPFSEGLLSKAWCGQALRGGRGLRILLVLMHNTVWLVCVPQPRVSSRQQPLRQGPAGMEAGPLVLLDVAAQTLVGLCRGDQPVP